MMDFLSGFLVITGSMLTFVTKGDSEAASADTEAAPSTSPGPSTSISTGTNAAAPSTSPGPSTSISTSTDATITTILLFGQHTYQTPIGLNLCTEGLLRLCQISLSLRRMEEVFIVVCPTGYLQMETR